MLLFSTGPVPLNYLTIASYTDTSSSYSKTRYSSGSGRILEIISIEAGIARELYKRGLFVRQFTEELCSRDWSCFLLPYCFCSA
jgi:hypothetical protein